MAKMEVNFRGHFGDDLEVVNAAKVSFGKQSKWANDADWSGAPKVLLMRDERLIQYLARAVTVADFEDMLDSLTNIAGRDTIADAIKDFRAHPQHRSPFNHCFASFHVRAPIFVARQLVKHEYLPWNEISGRYVTFRPDFYEHDAYRKKVDDKKQGSGDNITGHHEDALRAIFAESQEHAFVAYRDALAMGLCEEQARALLPLNLMTEWRWSGTLGAWAKMAAHRIRPDAQHETRLLVQQIDAKMAELFPVSWGALVHGKY